MSSLKIRVDKLESKVSHDVEPIKISIIIVDPGGIDPIGYRCGDIKIIREPNEAEEEFKKRCHDSVYWPPGTSRHIFHPIYVGH